MTPRPVKQLTQREMESLLGISPSPDRASRDGEDSPIQQSLLVSQDHLTPRPVKQLTQREMEVLLGISPSVTDIAAEDSRAPEPHPVPSDAQGAAVNFHGADEDESPGGAVALDPLLEPPFAKGCDIESPFRNRLLVRFDFDGENQVGPV